ncbi:uncharacterized protein B0I36DRAFT_405503 [Microdochium trichocladiopsis]|uniref:Uncharacterized protein n=1 Tax=Microdochium trichocladiopsis TaxID=1682393 RepID=A0A9P9BSV2_9PEZI|nr:uncharacterized protein B0I36DRAFT_405503 [Microdochium trichocladiopsis]KAH7034979.1 hypothetical protein B0I36DRAFT_405503 [Microdochium trichocladiopsis]
MSSAAWHHEHGPAHGHPLALMADPWSVIVLSLLAVSCSPAGSLQMTTATTMMMMMMTNNAGVQDTWSQAELHSVHTLKPSAGRQLAQWCTKCGVAPGAPASLSWILGQWPTARMWHLPRPADECPDRTSGPQKRTSQPGVNDEPLGRCGGEGTSQAGSTGSVEDTEDEREPYSRAMDWMPPPECSPNQHTRYCWGHASVCPGGCLSWCLTSEGCRLTEPTPPLASQRSSVLKDCGACPSDLREEAIPADAPPLRMHGCPLLSAPATSSACVVDPSFSFCVSRAHRPLVTPLLTWHGCPWLTLVLTCLLSDCLHLEVAFPQV